MSRDAMGGGDLNGASNFHAAVCVAPLWLEHGLLPNVSVSLSVQSLQCPKDTLCAQVKRLSHIDYDSLS